MRLTSEMIYIKEQKMYKVSHRYRLIGQYFNILDKLSNFYISN